MSGERFEFNTNDIYDLTRLTDVIRWAAKLGAWVANSENIGDLQDSYDWRREFEDRLSEMPRNPMGGFHIFGDAAVQAFTASYVKHKNASFIR